MKSLPSQLPIFIQVAKTRSFAAAARALGITPPAVSKAIGKLEEEWQIKLFYRSTHSLSLTQAGEQLFHRLSPNVDAIGAVISEVTDQQKEISGPIKVNLPASSLGQDILLPYIVEYMKHYPQVTCDIQFDDRNLDLINGGFDIAIGTAINQDSRLIARKLFQLETGLYAAATYIQEHGQPKSVSDLHQHQSISVRSVTTGRVHCWPLIDQGNEVLFEPKTYLSVNNFSAARQAMLLGAGIANLGSWMVREELQSGTVVPILKQHWNSQLPVWIYYPSRIMCRAELGF
ncbi:LysR family transcriptional regulator [Vibrio sonorensis]|uniref:LysR family transcriptional regulator n=1 Tax=Vibrio sonorensis TaxID=1004316 RepID=UPI001FDEF83A|nr:LysR family transcriptional regulator [Vibrio sonorensis]